MDVVASQKKEKVRNKFVVCRATARFCGPVGQAIFTFSELKKRNGRLTFAANKHAARIMQRSQFGRDEGWVGWLSRCTWLVEHGGRIDARFDSARPCAGGNDRPGPLAESHTGPASCTLRHTPTQSPHAEWLARFVGSTPGIFKNK